MSAPSIRLAGPAYLAASATDIYTPPTSSQVTLRTYLTQIHLANVTAGAITWTLYIGGTGGSTGGTEIGKGVSLPANSVSDLYFGDGIEMATTDFLSGLASSGSSITITINGYVQAV
jgi:hypothetical protein